MISKSSLKYLISYDHESGVLTWVKSRGTKKSGSKAGTVNSHGYVSVQVNKKIYRATSLIWVLVYGRMPNGFIDHINGNTTDNRLINLREVSNLENCRNQKVRCTNSTGIMGVQSLRGKYQVRISNGLKEVYLGYFSDFFEACCVRKSAERKFGYHKNHNNR